MLLTGFGVYDRLGQFAGAGTAVPVTGFGNSVISACIEHRTEGFVLGVGGNMFKLAGSVILFGVFSAFVIALIKTILVQWEGYKCYKDTERGYLKTNQSLFQQGLSVDHLKQREHPRRLRYPS